MSFYRPVYASSGSVYGGSSPYGRDVIKPADYQTISYRSDQNPTRSALYQSNYDHGGLQKIDERPRSSQALSDDLPRDTLQGMKKILVRFADKTSVQGVIYIKEAGRWASRSVWIFLFLVGTAAVLWQLTAIVQKYMSHPISTTIDIGYSSLNFPTVTVCNMNPLRLSHLSLHPKTAKHLKKLAASWEDSPYAGKPPPVKPPNRQHPPPPNKRKRRAVAGGSGYSDQYDYYAETFGMDDAGAKEDYGGGEVADAYKAELRFSELIGKIDRTTRERMGHQKNETILSCSFNGRKCSPANFTTFLDKQFGNCFQFNGFGGRLKPLKARESGVIHGLNLILYKQNREYLPGYTEKSGFRILLNEFRTMTFPVESGFSVPTGVEASIGFKLVNMSRLGKPFWQCANDDEFLKLYNRKYGIAACHITCEDRLVLADCRCIRLENYNNIPIANRTTRDCNTKADSKCVAAVKKAMKQSGKCSCEQSCLERYYNTDMSYAIWPNVGVWKTILDLVCQNDPYGLDCHAMVNATSSNDQDVIVDVLKQDFTSVKIYYTQLNYENIIEEESYGMATLAADVGGVLGLWLGFSVFTLFEVAYVLLQMCNYGVRKCKRRRQKTGPSSPRRKTKDGKTRVITRKPTGMQQDTVM